jgi:hypothetical protein
MQAVYSREDLWGTPHHGRRLPCLPDATDPMYLPDIDINGLLDSYALADRRNQHAVLFDLAFRIARAQRCPRQDDGTPLGERGC